MDTTTLIGRKVTLAQEFRGFTPETVWEVKNATSVGGKVILAVNNGTKGLAAPIEMFVIPEAEPVAPAPKPRATRFKMDGAEKDSPLYEVFQKCAPDDELSRELYVLYQSEYSEFDTDFLGTLAGQVNAALDNKWSKEQVGEMLQLLNATYDETAWRVPLPSGAEIVEGPVVETVPAARPAVVPSGVVVVNLDDMPDDDPEPVEMPTLRVVDAPTLAAAVDNLPPAEPVRRRGRPPGSRNKPRLEAAITVLKNDVDGHLARLPVNETKELARKVASSNTPADMIAIALELATAIAKAAAASGDEFPSVLEHSFGIVENLF